MNRYQVFIGIVLMFLLLPGAVLAEEVNLPAADLDQEEFFEAEDPAEENNSLMILLNAELLEMDQPPVITDGWVMIPVRAVSESLGAKVATDFEDLDKRLVYLSRGNQRIILEIGSQTAITGPDTVVELDIAPMIINDRVLVPLRFVAENLGATVEWHPEFNAVLIFSDGAGAIGQPEAIKTPAAFKTNIGFEQYYSPADYDKLISGNREAFQGDLVYVDGIVEFLTEYGQSAQNSILVRDGEKEYSFNMNGQVFNEAIIGMHMRLYGVCGQYNASEAGTPVIMLLRYTDDEGNTRALRSSGFEIAAAFEGDKLTDGDEIKAFLKEKAQDKSFGLDYFTYNVRKSRICDYAIVVGFAENHPMGNALRFENISDKQRADVEEILKERMKVIATALTQKCPGLTLEGYYLDSYWGVDEEGETVLYSMRHASWVNDPDIKGLTQKQTDGAIIWTPGEDTGGWIYESTRKEI